MTGPPPEVPDPSDTDKWLSWVVTERLDRLLAYAARARYWGDPSGAADLVQDAMLKIVAGDVDLPEDPERAWRRLLATIWNIARNGYRTAKVREEAPAHELRAALGRSGEGWEGGGRICERLDQAKALEAALEHLSPDEREMVELRYFEAWTNAEIAEDRECTPDAVRKRIAKALATMKVEIEGRFGAA